MSKKKTLEDIFNDDEFGILDSKPKVSNIKSEDERLIDSFQDINTFYEKNNREPKADVFVVSERGLGVQLKELRKNNKKIEVLKPYDIYNLLGNVEIEINSIDDILNDDEFGLLDTDDTLQIFKLKNVPSNSERAEADYFSRRKAIKEKYFKPYDEKFKKVHQDLKMGNRKLIDFHESQLQEGTYFVHNGILLMLEKTFDLEKDKYGKIDGRTRVVFENGTESGMKLRSLWKNLFENGIAVTHDNNSDEQILINNINAVNEEDLQTGWIYILKSKSTNKEIFSIKDLYKIGFSKIDVKERIKNASKEPTYLMADVEIVSAIKCYNLNPQKFEQLLHRFFAEACLNIDIYEKGKRLMPREWFVVPFPVIDRVIDLILNGEIVNYNYDKASKNLKYKTL